MLEAERYAHGFSDKMSELIRELQTLRREIEARWRDTIRAVGPPVG